MFIYLTIGNNENYKMLLLYFLNDICNFFLISFIENNVIIN